MKIVNIEKALKKYLTSSRKSGIIQTVRKPNTQHKKNKMKRGKHHEN